MASPTSEPYGGRYAIVHQVARGGMADVYLARDTLLDRPVALKVLFPALSVDRSFVERFRREAQAAANLTHPNIVPIYDSGQAESTYFIVMEYVDGQPLSALIRAERKIDPERAASIAADVAGALDYAHRHGVVHRDVKPGNVLLSEDGQVKVADFGIARAVNAKDESLTQTGAVMGTASYFSPEQADGNGVDARSDIYSLGIVLYEMATGQPPFRGDSPLSIAYKHRHEPPLPPRALNPSVPADLQAIILQALEKDPASRYQTAAAMRSDLQRFLQGREVLAPERGGFDPGVTTMLAPATTRTLSPTEVMTTERPRTVAPVALEDVELRSHRGLWTALTVLLLAIILVAGAVILRNLGLWPFVPKVTVPNVVGDTVQQAQTTLTASHLRSSVQGTVVAGDVVASTNPSPGHSVDSNSVVALAVGIPNVNLPNVKGLTYQVAKSQLQSLGFTVTEHQAASDQAIGVVINQQPQGGTTQAKGTSVTLTVSSGPAPVTVPNLEFDTVGNANSALLSEGLNVNGTSVLAYSPDVLPGLVIATDPTAGTKVPLNSSVTLIVSNGPAPSTTTTTTTTTSTTTTSTTSTTLGSTTTTTNPS